MKPKIDCVIVGYCDDTDTRFREFCQSPDSSAEYRIFRRDHLEIDGSALTYMDVINHFRQPASPNSKRHEPFYHVCEVLNLASVYLANFLRRRGFRAEFIGFFNGEKSRLTDLLAYRPCLLAITTTFYDRTWPVERIVELTRELSPETKIVVGGPLIYNLCATEDATRRNDHFSRMGADYYILESQGESSLADLVAASINSGKPSEVPNLFWRNGRAWQFTRTQAEANAMPEAQINWSQIDRSLLGKSVQTRTARSCAYSCAFCDYPLRAGRLAYTSPERVVSEARELVMLGVQNVIFVDDTFNVPEERFRAICRLLIAEDLPVSWFSYFRCSSVKDATTFDLMQQSGCAGVFLGIESGDDEVLKNMNKAASAERYRAGIRELKKRDILTFASFIAGYPGESQRSIGNTIAFINETAPDLYRMEPWWYNKRAPVEAHALKFRMTGEAYRWKHATMTIEEACDSVDRVFSEVSVSRWCPQQSFSFWAVPYLVGKGMSIDQVRSFHRLCHAVLTAQCAKQPRAREIHELGSFVQGLRLDDSRFTRL